MRKATAAALVILAASLLAVSFAGRSLSQGGGEGSLLSSPSTGGVKVLDIGPAALLPEYANVALSYEPRKIIYIVQDKEKAVRGKTTISFGPIVEDGKARTELVKTYEYPFRGRSALTANAESLAPVKYTLDFYPTPTPIGQPANKPVETWTSEYYYDMVAIRVEAGDNGTFASFRRPMKSFDFDELYLLLSQLNIPELPEKSVILVTAPFEHRNHAVLLESLGMEYIYAMDAERHACDHLRLTFVDFTEDYYVERRPPNRVVKFTQRGLTFTLLEDLTNRGEESAGEEARPGEVKHPGDFLLGGRQ